MPGCVLRATGATFNVDYFLQDSSLSPCNVFRKGEQKSELSQVKYERSGITIVVSEAPGAEIDKQFNDAIAFLQHHKNEITRLKENTGVEILRLDFGVELQIGYADSFWPGVILPEKLIQLAGELKLEIMISVFPDINPNYSSAAQD